MGITLTDIICFTCACAVIVAGYNYMEPFDRMKQSRYHGKSSRPAVVQQAALPKPSLAGTLESRLGSAERVKLAGNQAGSSLSVPARLRQPAPEPYPSCLDEIAGKVEAGKAIVIDKENHALYLYRFDGGWKIQKQYPISTGRNSGQKRYEGDRRSPEGNYKVAQKMSTDPGSPFYSQYLVDLNMYHRSAFGQYALHLDYPNDSDIMAGRTGSGIMIHNTSEGNVGKDSSLGCFGMRKEDVKELFFLVDAGTPVLSRARVSYAERFLHADAK